MKTAPSSSSSSVLERSLRQVTPAVYNLTDDTKQPYATVLYTSLFDHLTARGWRRQERTWYDEKETAAAHSHRVEWWNLGRDFLLVYVIGGDAIVSQPLTLSRLHLRLRRKR